ncbi:MAG TPA: ImmA/IrrE family metallo-endopeptidase [Patescibacteria group bacterium]|nr:ImmA/IrrE family metallo-endopeptidase [Patescibacteria group bacterium]
MSVLTAIAKAESLVKTYNPEGLSPFPYKEIEKSKEDLSIYLVKLPDEVSGAIRFNKEKNKFEIFVNLIKPDTRQYFTIAHELGHYFLHDQIVKGQDIVVDDDNQFEVNRTLYRLDQASFSIIETEANNFAASLIMPEYLVRKAWGSLQNVEECASLFKVSVVAMSIRLEKLHLL